VAVPLLRPGQTHAAVPRMKRALAKELVELGLKPIAAVVRLDSKTYGSATVKAVKKFQQKKGLGVDGVVGKDTWRALGVNEDVVDVRPVLHGVPWEPGVMPIDENFVDEVLGNEILAQRKAGRWTGRIMSGYRPPWYQKRLFDAAVAKYGSVEKARKWVAPPGKSRHGKKGGQGAVDVTPSSTGAQLDGAGRLFRPMSWEPWHVQMRTRDMPDEATRDVPDVEEGEEEVEFDAEPPTAELEESGVTMDDVDETIAVQLERLQTPDEDLEAEPSGQTG
jgi:hypothetical protein